MIYRTSLIAAIALTVSACATRAPEAPDVFIPPPVIKSCYQTSELQRVVIPAEYETFYAITEIENPPYEPIQRREELQREVTPERVMYTDDDGAEVTNICGPDEVGVILPPEPQPES